ncbi:MAG: hypothetical protein ACK521_01325, partial [bacterium]
ILEELLVFIVAKHFVIARLFHALFLGAASREHAKLPFIHCLDAQLLFAVESFSVPEFAVPWINAFEVRSEVFIQLHGVIFTECTALAEAE